MYNYFFTHVQIHIREAETNRNNRITGIDAVSSHSDPPPDYYGLLLEGLSRCADILQSGLSGVTLYIQLFKKNEMK